ncbi:MAG TPA: winged helix-turn-helix domain-containing protein [Acidimicrobiales bacterium]|nr:winged helix-turn-helix domain-containing protein [Acidimicrobiales bacterium]
MSPATTATPAALPDPAGEERRDTPAGENASPSERRTGGDGIRELTAAQEMRALTHPVRLALLELLSLEGPMTATEAGERIGESPTTCSFHLRQLAKYGFVEEAGRGAGRRRPWKLVDRGLSFSGIGDEEQSVAASELSNMLLERWLARYRSWQQVQHLDPEWAHATGTSESAVFLTKEEAVEVREQVAAILRRYEPRRADPAARPEGSRPVEAVLLVHPIVDAHSL